MIFNSWKQFPSISTVYVLNYIRPGACSLIALWRDDASFHNHIRCRNLINNHFWPNVALWYEITKLLKQWYDGHYLSDDSVALSDLSVDLSELYVDFFRFLCWLVRTLCWLIHLLDNKCVLFQLMPQRYQLNYLTVDITTDVST